MSAPAAKPGSPAPDVSVPPSLAPSGPHLTLSDGTSRKVVPVRSPPPSPQQQQPRKPAGKDLLRRRTWGVGRDESDTDSLYGVRELERATRGFRIPDNVNDIELRPLLLKFVEPISNRVVRSLEQSFLLENAHRFKGMLRTSTILFIIAQVLFLPYDYVRFVDVKADTVRPRPRAPATTRA